METKPLIQSESDVKTLLKPIVVGGDILAYSYVRELHRAFGIESTIVLAAADIKMLSTSRFTDYRLTPDIHDAAVLYRTLEEIAHDLKAENPAFIPLVLGCDDCHARMLSSGKKRLKAAGIVVPYIDFDLLDEIAHNIAGRSFCPLGDAAATPIMAGIKRFRDAHPDIPVFTASIDAGLNEKGYIMPGLGDAGDRMYGTK